MANKPWKPEHQALQKALKQMRRYKKLTQEQLAQLIGKSQNYISKCERGERKVGYIEALEIMQACGNTAQDFQLLYETKVAETRAEYIFRKPKKPKQTTTN